MSIVQEYSKYSKLISKEEHFRNLQANEHPQGAACLLAHISNGYSDKRKSLVNLYEKDVVVRKFWDCVLSKRKGGGIREKIFEFSDASKRRLLFVCRNSGHKIRSQVCLTFHKSSPINGKAFKKTLNIFLTRMRREYKGIHYIWVLEFQKNGNPHAHLFTDIEPTKENRDKVARLWNKTTKESHENYKFTAHKKNFFSWKMQSGSYLAKEYIAKSVQKDVPKHYKNVGRFWGNSRNMVPNFALITEDLFDDPKIYIKALRAVYKCHERKILKYVKKRINLRKKHITINIPSLSKDFIKLLKYYSFYGYEETGAKYEPINYLICSSFEYGVPF